MNPKMINFNTLSAGGQKERADWIYVAPNGMLKVSTQKLYMHLKENLNLKITEKGNLFLYEKPIYRLISPKEFKGLIKSYIPIEIRTEKDWEAVYKEFSTDEPNIFESDFNSNEKIVGFNNGILNLKSGELEEYNEDVLLTRIVSCDYQANKTLNDAPAFQDYLKTLCNNDENKINFLLEYIGGILSNVKGYKFKILLILVGEGNTGKTQIRELTMEMLGRNHCVSIDMKKINDRFGAAQLYRKRLAGSGDMSTVEIAEMNVIKNLTGGDSLFAEYKGKDGFNFCYDGFLWFNANSLPHFRGDRGQHVYDRFAIIECSNIIPTDQRDPLLLEKMLKEKDIIASIAIDKFRKAVNRGYKFSISEEMKQNKRNYQIENNSLLLFVKECCELYTVNDKIKRSEFNDIYKRWCSANRILPERDRDIGKQLSEYFLIDAHKISGHYFYPLKIKIDILNEYKKGESYFEFNGFSKK